MLKQSCLLLFVICILLGCGGDDTSSSPPSQPITPSTPLAPSPTLSFSQATIQLMEGESAEIAFDVTNVGTDATYQVTTDESISVSVQPNNKLNVMAHSIDYYSVDFLIELTVTDQGRSAKSSTLVTVMNQAQPLLDEVTALLDYLPALGQEDIAIAEALSYVGKLNNIDLSHALSSFKLHILDWHNSGSVTEIHDQLNLALQQYQNNQMSDSILAEELQTTLITLSQSEEGIILVDALSSFVAVVDINLSASDIHAIYFDPIEQKFSRYRGNPALGQSTHDGSFSFGDEYSVIKTAMNHIQTMQCETLQLAYEGE